MKALRRTRAASRPTRRRNFLFVDIGRPAARSATRAPTQGIVRRPRLPAVRADARAHLHRHDGRDAEGDRGLPRRAAAGDDRRRRARDGRRQDDRMAMLHATQIRAGGRASAARRCRGVDRRARPRGTSVWSALRADARGGRRRRPMILPRATRTRSGPARRCSTPCATAFGPAGAHAGPLLRRRGGDAHRRASPRQHGVKPENIVARLRVDADPADRRRTCSRRRTRRSSARFPTYEECAGYAEMMGHPVRAVPLDRDFNDRSRQDRRRRARRRARLLLQPEQPDGHLRRRAGDARLPRAGATAISPETTILVDEAYFDYVTDPDHATHIPLRRRGSARRRRAHVLEGVRHGRACASATRSATPTRSGRWPTGTAGPAPAR